MIVVIHEFSAFLFYKKEEQNSRRNYDYFFLSFTNMAEHKKVLAVECYTWFISQSSVLAQIWI